MSTSVDVVRRFRRLRALVIGDAMLDTYLEGTAERLCSEGPVPVVRKTAEQRVPGGAANAAANVRALGAEVALVGVVGADIAANVLRQALRERGVDDGWLVRDEDAATLHKMRILANGQYVVRFDDAEPTPYSRDTEDRLIARVERNWSGADVVVISDYRYGVLCDRLIARIADLQTQAPRPLLIDSKALARLARIPATVVTPNHLEACLLAGGGQGASSATLAHPTVEEMERVGRRLLARIQSHFAAITMAGDGVLVVEREGSARHVPTERVARAHDVGAGDSFAAATALALGAGAEIEDAVRLGIEAASIAITRRWTAVVPHQELLQRASLRDDARAQDTASGSAAQRAVSLRRVVRQLDEARAAGRTIVFTNGVFDLLHAGHVKFLRQARALGDVLVVGVNSDASARRLSGKVRPIMGERDRLALVSALDAVDYALLFDEQQPAELIRALRPDVHAKGGDYADEDLPEAAAVREVGGQVVILPLAGAESTTSVIERIVAQAWGAADARVEVEP
jgi:D-beta-D-heptose 7-phosphate kinase / D-beta-D-heptose 1-phosphate adenosyltransferase